MYGKPVLGIFPMLLTTRVSKHREPGTAFGARLRRLRTERGLTQKELADMVGMKLTAMSRLEWSPTANPTLSTVEKLADALGVSVRQLVSDVPEPSEN
jgi:transcriptional regulator with XRE-family HTH domain